MTIDRRIFRQADFIEVAVANVFRALRDGGLLVVLIVIVFLANGRASAITLTAIRCRSRQRFWRCARSVPASTR